MAQSTLVIGLTGQSGAGKTTVSRILSERGYPVIDADLVARYVVQKGKRCLLDLTLEFGVDILDGEGSLNRRKLGGMVFADGAKRKRLGEITFPYIQEEIVSRINGLKEAGEPVVILDAPTLLESGGDRFCDKVVSVIAPRHLRVNRILLRDDRTRQEIEARINAQQDDEFYTSRSNFVIYNNKDLAHLRLQVVEMLNVCGQAPPQKSAAGEEGRP